mgnify:CR=1 FL=1
MATYYSSADSRGYRIRLEISQTSQSVPNNTSSISYALYLENVWYTFSNYNSTGSLVIDGSTVWSLAENYSSPTAYNSEKLLTSGTRTISHASNGTKTLSFSASFKTNVSGSYGTTTTLTISDNLVLTTIPRASSISRSSSTVTTGNTQVFTISRASTSFTHTIQYSIGSLGWTNLATGVETSYTWTVPHSLISYISNATSGTVSIRVLTYSGGTHIGTSSTITFAAAIPASSVSRNYSSRQIGQSVTLTANRVNTKLTHTLQWKLSNTSYANINTGIATTQAWTLPTSMIGSISNAASATITVRCLTYNGSAYIGATTVTLTGTIPTSTFSFDTSAVYINGSKTLGIARAHTNLTHNIRYRLNSGSWSSNFATGVATSYSWTLPESTLAAGLSAATHGTITVEATTKNGTVTVGTSTAAFTVDVPNAAPYLPTITSTTIARSGTTPASFSASTFIKGKHAINASFTPAAGSGASVAANEITIDGTVYSGSSKISPTINKTGLITVKFKTTDSRGRSVTSTDSTTNFINYFNPTISTFTASRSGANETDLSVAAEFSIADVLNENNKAYTIEYKKVNDITWTTLQTGNVYTFDDTIVGTGVLTEDDSYDVRLSLTDSYNTTPVIRTTDIGTAFVLMNFNASGKGVAIGKVSESDTFEVALPTDFAEMPTVAGVAIGKVSESDSFEVDLDIEFNKNVNFTQQPRLNGTPFNDVFLEKKFFQQMGVINNNYIEPNILGTYNGGFFVVQLFGPIAITRTYTFHTWSGSSPIIQEVGTQKGASSSNTISIVSGKLRIHNQTGYTVNIRTIVFSF